MLLVGAVLVSTMAGGAPKLMLRRIPSCGCSSVGEATALPEPGGDGGEMGSSAETSSQLYALHALHALQLEQQDT